MKTSVALLLFVLLPINISYCRVVERRHRHGWGPKLDLKEKSVQQFLKHKKVEDASKQSTEFDSSGYYNEFGVEDDSEGGDDVDEEEERQLRLNTEKGGAGCVHPKSHNMIDIGSFDFDEKSCMVCECPSGKLNCYKTC